MLVIVLKKTRIVVQCYTALSNSYGHLLSFSKTRFQMCSPWTAVLLIRCQKKQEDSTSTTCSTSGKKREKDRERAAEICVKIMSRCLRRCQQISLFLKEKSSKQKRYHEDTTRLLIYDDLNTRREMRLFIITVRSYKSILLKWIKHNAAFAG